MSKNNRGNPKEYFQMLAVIIKTMRERGEGTGRQTYRDKETERSGFNVAEFQGIICSVLFSLVLHTDSEVNAKATNHSQRLLPFS